MADRDTDPFRLGEALAGDDAAWGHIVESFSQNLWHWARSQGLSRSDAEDVAQTVWYRLKDRGHTIRDPRTLPGWLATTTRREARRVREHRAVPVHQEVFDRIESPRADAADVASSADLSRRLAAAYTSLRPACRELLALCWDDRLSYADIAQMLEKPIGSIGPTRQRCLDDLRQEAGV